jgi:hypothetical protein
LDDIERIHDKLDKIFEEVHRELPKIPLIEKRLENLEETYKDLQRLAVLENTVRIVGIQIRVFWGLILASLAWLAQKFFGSIGNGH